MVTDTLTAIATFILGGGLIAACLYYLGWDKHG